jgi:hypothetical protein
LAEDALIAFEVMRIFGARRETILDDVLRTCGQRVKPGGGRNVVILIPLSKVIRGI